MQQKTLAEIVFLVPYVIVLVIDATWGRQLSKVRALIFKQT